MNEQTEEELIEKEGSQDEPGITLAASGASSDVAIKKRKENKVLALFYGPKWDGKCDKIGELMELLPLFKDYYFTRKRADMKTSSAKIIIDFNDKMEPCHFYPWPTQYQNWRRKWDKELMLELGYEEEKLRESRRIKNVVAVRDADRALIPSEDELESGAKTLGGLLINDAVDMLQRDKELEEIYTSDELIKRKSYAVNVFAHVTRNVQGKEALKIKRQAEGRETTNFLMGIMSRAVAGKITPEEISVLKGAVTINPNPNEQQVVSN